MGHNLKLNVGFHLLDQNMESLNNISDKTSDLDVSVQKVIVSKKRFLCVEYGKGLLIFDNTHMA